MILSQLVQDAIARLKQYNLGLYNSASNKFGLSGVGGMAANWSRHSKDIATTCEAVAGIADEVIASTTAAAGSASAAAGSAIAADASRAATQTLLTQGQATVQGLVTQAQTARDGAAADRVLAQSYVGTATNMIVPAINYRLASAWDANGQPTAYALPGVVAVHRYDTRKDWDRGAWRRGRLARQSSWYQEALNTATRGGKREFPVVALLVVTTSLFVVYDLHDLDANGSPRMWMVQNNGNGALVLNAITNTAPTCVSARSGLIYVGTASSTATHVVGAPFLDFLRDRAGRVTGGGTLLRTTGLANRNVGVAAEASLSSASLASNAVYSIDMRVLPGCPLDPVSRLPVPTIAVATAGGVSVLHPTGLVASITRTSGFSRVMFVDDQRMLAQFGGTNSYSVGAIPYSTVAAGSWGPGYYIDGSTTAIRHIGGVVYGMLAAAPGAIGHDNGLTLIAEDKANFANSLVSHVARTYATGWMSGDVRLAAICEGAGSAGDSGGELIQTPDFSSTAGWTANAGWSVSGGFANFTSATGNSINTPVSVTPGTDYTATLVVASISGVLQVSLQGGTQVLGPTISAPGTYQIPLRAASGNALVIIYAGGGTTAAVDALSLRKAGTFSDAVTGSGELVGNGDFASGNTSGWTAASGTLSVVAGKMRLTAAGGSVPYATYAVPTKAGENYSLTVDFAAGTALGYVQVGSTSGGADLYIASQGAGTGPMSCQFKAIGSTSYITVVNTNSLAGTYADWNKVSVRSCLADRSTRGKGARVAGTLIRAPVAAGSDIYATSGFGAGKNLTVPYTPDHSVGTGDLCITFWHRAGYGSGWPIYYANSTGSGAWWRVGHNVSGAIFTVSDGVNSAVTSTTTGFSDGSWHLGEFILRAAPRRLEYWCDGVLVQSVDATAVGSLSNATAYTTIGAAFDGSTPAFTSDLALLRISA